MQTIANPMRMGQAKEEPANPVEEKPDEVSECCGCLCISYFLSCLFGCCVLELCEGCGAC